jgi:ABC-type glycerol-3-phosphate transport system substrate-binding protein
VGGYRPMSMKRLLGPALLAVVLSAGCGDSTSDGASQPAPQPSSTSTTASDEPTASAAPQTIAIVSQTAAGGQVDLNAVPVDDDAALQEFTAQFSRAGLEEKIATAVAGATVPEGYAVMGAVVAIGCDVPPDVSVEQGPDGWVVTPHKVPSPLQECFAPVTSVAIVAVPA